MVCFRAVDVSHVFCAGAQDTARWAERADVSVWGAVKAGGSRDDGVTPKRLGSFGAKGLGVASEQEA